jgi:precorrin-6A synthase
MREILVIGIGAGDPEHVTMQAVNALNQADVFFVVDKGEDKGGLLELRREICERYITRPGYRVVTAPETPRDRQAAAYRAAVDDWRGRRADAYERLIAEQLGPDEHGAFLAWGDPSIYDSTLHVLDDVRARGTVGFEIQVIPGISSIQALAARHQISLTRTGRPLHITTGRLLAQGFPDNADDVVVMLDAGGAFEGIDTGGARIYWGAYVGSPDEILIEGDAAEAGPRIAAEREAAREQHGWIMDSYLLRRPAAP